MTAPGPASSGEPSLRAAPFARPDRAYRRVLVVTNPHAGRGLGPSAARELAEGLHRSGVPVDVLVARRNEAFLHLRTRPDDTDLVVAVGGDGTVREVLDGLVDPEVHVGLLPYGTANALATEFGYPRDVHMALEILARRRVAGLDVARTNGTLSILATGIGIDAMTLDELAERRYGRVGLLEYVDAFTKALKRSRPPRLRVTVDGEELPDEYGFVLVTNVPSYAGLLHLAEDARLDDGRFEVYLFPTGRLRELAAFVLRGIFHRLPGGVVTMRRARRVRVTSETEVPYHVDGRLLGATPVEVEIAPNQYRLVVP